MSDRAYVLINVLPGQTSNVVKSLKEIKEIKNIDPCWGKPDIFAIVEVPDQDALTTVSANVSPRPLSAGSLFI